MLYFTFAMVTCCGFNYCVTMSRRIKPCGSGIELGTDHDVLRDKEKTGYRKFVRPV